ncbi:hypothetical protein [Micromonospora sp. WMMD737]|uniref:hypothetical protein n=1 Tax=Micromonospora sp. WMMD737 TaxID=3404113 RepID=UPI003B957348
MDKTDTARDVLSAWSFGALLSMARDMQSDDSMSRGEQAEAAEREAAKQRLLDQAEAERVPVEETTRAVPDRRWRRDQR